jgi:hypothetical protein
VAVGSLQPLGDLSRTGREKTTGEREKEKLWSLGCATCRLLLDPFLGGFGGTGLLAGWPSVRVSPGTKKKAGQTSFSKTHTAFQTLAKLHY